MTRLFGTDGIRGKYNLYPMTQEIMLKLGKSIASMFKNKVVLGKDTRQSGHYLETALCAGINSLGADVLHVGVLPTPAIAYLTKQLQADIGIVISASHNPAGDNGVKIFKNGIKLTDEEEAEIESLMEKELKEIETGKIQIIRDGKKKYIEFAKSTIKQDIKDFKIVLDCANGAAFKVAPEIFKQANLIILNTKPNGLNINLNCGALHPELISKQVIQHKADIGIAFDGDADRLIICDEKGEILNGDHIMAIIALDMLKNKKLNNNTLVATFYSNMALDKTIEEHGGKVLRVKNGDRYVIAAMLENNLNFGGERSGHIILSDYTTTGDGIIVALKILEIMRKTKKPLSQLKTILEEYPQVLLNIKVKKKKKFSENIKALIKQTEQTLKDKGRLLIRYSGTENIARVMIEGEDKELINQLANKIADKIRKELA